MHMFDHAGSARVWSAVGRRRILLLREELRLYESDRPAALDLPIALQEFLLLHDSEKVR